MAYFHNRSVNLVNLHYLICAVAFSGGGAFWLVYLLKAGLSIPAVLLATAATFAVRFVLRLLVLPIGIRLGLRRLLMLGAAAMAVKYPVLAAVHGLGVALVCLVLVNAISDAIYWPAYHAYFAALGDAEHRGQQTGAREAVAAALGIVSPLAAGILLVTFGPIAAFWATAVVQLTSVVPLLWTPDVRIAPEAPSPYRHARSGIILFVADGWIAAGYSMVWQIALFISLSSSYLAFGGALAVAALVGSLAGLVLGRLIDAGEGTRAAWLAIATVFFVMALRATSLHQPVLAVTANALGALAGCIYIPTLMTAIYNSAKRSTCVLRYHLALEGAWDVGVTAGLCVTAAIIYFGGGLAWAIATSTFGAIAAFVVLTRYYAAHASEAVATEFASAPATMRPTGD